MKNIKLPGFIITLLATILIFSIVYKEYYKYKEKQKKSYSNIVITVPHSHCFTTKTRICDKLAFKAAQLLEKKLKPYKIFYANYYREDTDLNREEARNTKFRKALKPILEDCRKSRKKCLLFDIHSFPEGSITIEGAKEPDVYFIKSFYDNLLCTYLYEYLKKFNINTALFDGPAENDILLEAAYNKIPGVIIEFKESLSDINLEKIVNIIVEGISKYTTGVS